MKTFSDMVGGSLLVTVISLIGSIPIQAQLPTSALLDTNTVLAETLLLPPLNLPLVEPSEVTESGSFYSIQRTDYPPLPFSPIPWLPVYLLETNASGPPWFGYDDRAVDYDALEAQWLATRLSEAAALGMSLEEMELLESGGPYGADGYSTNDLWLEITAFTNNTAALVIHQPWDETNIVHDLFYTTDLASPIYWRFLMRTTSMNVLVPDLCDPQGFFRLGQTNGDLTVTTNATPQQLAQLLVPPWVIVTNATYTGATVARGTFTNGNGCGLPIETGVILATGYITNAIGTNNDNGLVAAGTCSVPGPSDLGMPGDTNLDNLTGGGPTFDAAVLEFDIISTNSFTLCFRFVFASEEYPEFIGNYNDPMAIFISTNQVGTNWIIDATNNIALVPGTTNLVSVNTINEDTNPQYYVDNGDPIYSTNKPVFNIQYDGITVLLTAKAQISPGISNHVKIAIADYGTNICGADRLYDSAIFIKNWSPCPCQ